MEGIKPPAEFVPYSNEKKWETWRESFEIFAIAVNLESMPLVRQRAILKHIAGEKRVMIYKTFHISENDTYPNVKEMLDMLTSHFKPFKNTIQRRNAFFTCVQKERQGIMEFVTELKHLAQECEFENLTESLIRDRLIIGILDREVKRKLLEDPQLTLPRAISIAMVSESTCSQVASLNEQKMIEKTEKRNWVKDTIRMENAEAGPSGINPRRERIIEPCKWCGQRHKYGKCPAYGKKCNACGKTNHFTVVCRTKRIRNLLAESEAEESCDEINLNEVVVKTVGSDKWSAVIIINGKKTTVHLDTGAQINVLPHKVINQWPSRPEIRPTSLKAFAYGNTELPIVGKCNVLCQYGEKKGMFKFIVADVEAQTLTTGDTCEKLEILRRINHINTDEMKLCSETQKILEQYHEVFQGVGLINSECKIYTKPEYSPVQVPPRRIPTSLGAEVQSELEKMVKQGIVTKIYHETEWSHPMVVVKKKSGQIRICLDPRKLNEALVGRHFQTPAPAELLHEIPKAKYYTVLDVKSAYWHIPVAKECRDLLVRFLGHLISQNGIDPEPNKIDKLITFKRPEDKKSLQRIMGLYNYLGKFIPNLAASTSNIRGILRKNVVWHWGPKQDGEFDHIKECIRNAPSLAHFDKSKMLILQCDASKDAMGAALLQEDRPLAFASASFSDSQKQYSQIEKELLSVYYGCKKFEYLLSGHTFVVQTDHQPLLPLVKKPLSDISPRLQRLVMKLIAFDFKLQYKPGKYLIVADTLSRDTHPMDELPTPFLEDKRMVKMVCVNIMDEKLVAMQKDTRENPALVKVIDYVIEGWPICKKDVDEDAKVFFYFRHRLYLWNDLLCIGSAIVIPKTQRNNMLNLLHQSHQGISAIQGLARESLFWPKMSIDIAEKVKNCEICQKYQKSKIRQPLKPFPVPDYPWQTVSLDIFYIQKKPHLLVVDRYSGYPEVFALDPPTAINVKNKLRETFARFGIPETMMSDNGPLFRSEIMTDFCIRWGIKQLFSSPHLHRSNGIHQKMTYLHPHSYVYRGAFDVKSPELHRYIDHIKLCNWRSIENAKRKRQSSMKEHYDRNSKSYPKVNVGEDAWCQMHPRETWTPVKISAQADSPQSFEVVTPSGNRLIRNQQFIRPRDGVNEKRQLSSEPITGSPEAQHPHYDSQTMGESSTAPIQRSSEETNIDQREGATTSAAISPEPSGGPRFSSLNELHHDNNVLNELHHDNNGLNELHHDNNGLSELHHDNNGLNELQHDNNGLNELHHDNNGLNKLHRDNNGLNKLHRDNNGLNKLHHDNNGLNKLHHDNNCFNELHQDNNGLNEFHHDNNVLNKLHHDNNGLNKLHHDNNGLNELHHDNIAELPTRHGNRAAMWPKPCDKFHTFDLTSSRQCSRQQATINFTEATSFYKLYMERLPRQQDDHQRPNLKVELKQRSSIVLPKQQSLKREVINQVDSQFPRQATHTVTCGGMQRPLSHLDRRQKSTFSTTAFLQGQKAAEAARDICNVYGKGVIGERAAQKWFGKFKNGDLDLEDTTRSGRPSEFDEEHLKGLLKEDGRQTTIRSGKMQDASEERIKIEESAKPQPGATISQIISEQNNMCDVV
ncbi:K02A2.6-like [Cordylochernes scorpioides]|uniref:RNA-directed DNA polymerase n=1 Tax=Cordylochernes scorpioides TaxID=51811 RepID=A0ABY6KLM4_9ARAC|nr:K02A2.6-like [Cordylochernes scorpioides]